MKRNFTSRAVSVKWAFSKSLLALSFCAFFCAAAFGQSAGQVVELGDLSAVNWKSAADFDQTILQETARMDAVLAPAGVQAADRALFLSYKRLVTYIQSDVLAGRSVGEVFIKRYQQVMAEAPQDPDMKHLLPGTLEGLLPGLVEVLMATPELFNGGQ